MIEQYLIEPFHYGSVLIGALVGMLWFYVLDYIRYPYAQLSAYWAGRADGVIEMAQESDEDVDVSKYDRPWTDERWYKLVDSEHRVDSE